MNLVQLATELEYVPKDQLAQMSQDPNNRFPQYLVLSEIQRRTANEKAYAAAQPQPTTTVAEEVVGEFMQPKGLQAGMPSVSAPTDSFSTEPMGMPASAPMQQPIMGMAEGGKTNFGSPEAVMSQTGSELKRLRKAKEQYQIDDYGRITQLFLDGLIDENQMSKMYRMRTDRFLKDQERGRFKPFYGTKIKSLPNTEKGLQSAMEQSRNEMQQRQQGLASGGLTAFAAGDRTALESSFGNPFVGLNTVGTSTNPYFQEELITEEPVQTKFGAAGNMLLDAGSDLVNWAKENPTDAALTGLMFVPGLGWAASAGLKTVQLATKAMKGKNVLKSLYSKPKPLDVKSTKTPSITGGKKLDAAESLGYGSGKSAFGKIDPGREFSSKRYLGSTAGLYGAKKAFEYGMSPSEAQIIKNEEKKKEEENRKNSNQTKTNNNKKDIATGMAKPKKEIDYDLVGLGGLIMGSKNISDLGMGLAGLAESKQNRQAAKEKLDLERQLTEAQVMSLEGKSKYADTEALQSYLTAKKQQISDQLDSGLLSQERAAKELEKLAPAEARLIQMYEMLFGGIANSANSDEDFLKSLSA